MKRGACTFPPRCPHLGAQLKQTVTVVLLVTSEIDEGVGRSHPRKSQFEMETWYEPGGICAVKVPSGLSGMFTAPPLDAVRTSCLVEYMSRGTWQELTFTTAGSGQRTIVTLPTTTPRPVWVAIKSVWLVFPLVL